MSGIAGVFHQASEQDVERMLSKLRHRGPDGRGIKNLPMGTLGHTYLAIADTEDGKQPFGNHPTWITFDGEIYNYLELAQDYLDEESLEITSDKEVLFHLYRKFGPRCVEMLDGTFAFAIMDDKALFLARDPLGIKPMYCGVNQHAFYFASEIKALAEVAQRIHEFPAGCWFHSREGWHAYFDIDSVQEGSNSAIDASKSIGNVTRDAVRKRLLGNAPVGIHLSGELGSNIVAALASQETSHIHSFSASLQSSENLASARKTAGLLGTQHHERIFTEAEILTAIPKIIYHLESFEPAIVRSAIPSFFLAEIASKYVKVILTDEGAKEIYAGHDYFHSFVSPEERQNELIDITAGLHNTVLQRADRIPMAFGLEERLPFLDIKLVVFGLCLPMDQKNHLNRPATHSLKQAFRDILPKEFLVHTKQKILREDRLSGLLMGIAEDAISDDEFKSEHARLLNRWGYRLSNKEALYYYKLLRQFYEDRWIFPALGMSRTA